MVPRERILEEWDIHRHRELAGRRVGVQVLALVGRERHPLPRAHVADGRRIKAICVVGDGRKRASGGDEGAVSDSVWGFGSDSCGREGQSPHHALQDGFVLPSKFIWFIVVKIDSWSLRCMQPEDNESEVEAMQGNQAKLVVIPSVWGHMGTSGLNLYLLRRI